jgi:hypothetical protein
MKRVPWTNHNSNLLQYWGDKGETEWAFILYLCGTNEKWLNLIFCGEEGERAVSFRRCHLE